MATLRQLAKRRRDSQRALATRVGVSSAAIFQLLDRQNVTLASVAAVVGALGGSVAAVATIDGAHTIIDFPTDRPRGTTARA